MKIAFLNMNVRNLGDLVIRDTSRYLLDEAIAEGGLDGCEVMPVDIGEHRNFELYSFPIRYAMRHAVGAFVTRRSFSEHHPLAAQRALRWAWRHSTTGKCFLKREFPKLEGADLIVFGGGGLIKYRRQSFHYIIDAVTCYALEHDIPVLFNAVGVEGYEEGHPGCALLKQALNRDCVKFISTRDDYSSLTRNYVVDEHVATDCVCDPAFWTPEAYGIAKAPRPTGTIGVNVIRPKIYADYAHAVDDNLLDRLYHDLTMRLLDAGFKVDLLSNGVLGDTRYLEHLLKAFPDIAGNPDVTHHAPTQPAEFVGLIAGYERVLAVRLHTSIVSTALGIPNASLVWNAKQTMFGERIGKSENYLTLEHFNVEEVYGRLMGATPYEMDGHYKDSVKASLAREVKRWLAADAGQPAGPAGRR